MKKEQFIEYIEDQGRLNESSAKEFEQIVNKYPYFQSANLLFLKNLRNLKNPEYYNWLKKLVITIPNRELFYSFINEDEIKRIASEEKNSEKPKKEEKKVKPGINKKEKKVLENEANETDLLELDEAKNNYGNSFDTKINVLEGYEDNSEKKGNKLIDEFIEKQPRIKPVADIHDPNIEINDVSEESVKENEEFVSETLAKIYIKQGYYSKAIFIYEKLSLKYPEKNAYFATQIEKIKQQSNKK